VQPLEVESQTGLLKAHPKLDINPAEELDEAAYGYKRTGGDAPWYPNEGKGPSQALCRRHPCLYCLYSAYLKKYCYVYRQGHAVDRVSSPDQAGFLPLPSVATPSRRSHHGTTRPERELESSRQRRKNSSGLLRCNRQQIKEAQKAMTCGDWP
jgi:hypothetical protein